MDLEARPDFRMLVRMMYSLLDPLKRAAYKSSFLQEDGIWVRKNGI
jgi:hypothetical protein